MSNRINLLINNKLFKSVSYSDKTHFAISQVSYIELIQALHNYYLDKKKKKTIDWAYVELDEGVVIFYGGQKKIKRPDSHRINTVIIPQFDDDGYITRLSMYNTSTAIHCIDVHNNIKKLIIELLGNKIQYIPSYDEWYMKIADTVKLRSKDPCSQVGAVIVSERNKIISTGYNDFPIGCSNTDFSWKKSDGLDNKKLFVVHAELNAILNAELSTKNGTIYVTRFPCNECAKAIIQSGILKIVVETIPHVLSLAEQASIKMLKSAGVEIIELKSTKR